MKPRIDPRVARMLLGYLSTVLLAVSITCAYQGWTWVALVMGMLTGWVLRVLFYVMAEAEEPQLPER